MSKKFLIDIDLNGNELQNFVVQNLATAPANPVTGRHYFNTTDHTEYFYDGTAWVNASGDYTFQNGIEQSGKNVQIKLGTSTNVTLTADSTGLYAEVADASTSAKGVIEIATDEEAATGTSETLAVNPKQLKTKVDANAAITGAQKCKITYDAKGLVTAGDDLVEADIPELHLTKITDVTADASEINILDGATLTTTELNYVDGVTSSIQDQLDAKLELDSLSIASTSANYLEYNNTNGEFGAKVDTNVTANSTNLVTSGAVKSAIDAAITGGVHYAGTFDITSATDYSGISVPQTKGALFYVTGTGPKTISGIEWNQGDYLLLSNDCATVADIATYAQKVDNTESSDIVRLDAAQTLTNKTIDADDNTISDLTTSNLKSGVLQTSVRASGTATDTTLVSEAAVRTELDTKQDKVAAAVENNIASWDGAGSTKDSGKAFVTSIDDSASADNNSIPTELAVATFVENSIAGAKAEYKNTAITPVSGTATWSLNSLPADPMNIVIIETATGEQVEMNIVYGTKAATITFNASAAVTANTYTAKVLF